MTGRYQALKCILSSIFQWFRLLYTEVAEVTEVAEEGTVKTNLTGARENPYSSLPFMGGRQGWHTLEFSQRSSVKCTRRSCQMVTTENFEKYEVFEKVYTISAGPSKGLFSILFLL